MPSWRAMLIAAQMEAERAQERYWDTVTRARAQGLTAREIGSVLSVSPATVTRNSEAPKTLRAKLSDDAPEGER